MIAVAMAVSRKYDKTSLTSFTMNFEVLHDCSCARPSRLFLLDRLMTYYGGAWSDPSFPTNLSGAVLVEL
jgi:hypothetical protein